MILILTYLSFFVSFLIGFYMLQNLKNKLILNFKIIFTLNLIFFTFYILKNYNIELEQFCIMFINLILFKFIILIILQGTISSIQIQTLYNIKTFAKINYKYNFMK